VGDVELGGGSLPAVRVELNPLSLNKAGVSLEDVRAALQAASANRPKGSLDGPERRLQIYTGYAHQDLERSGSAAISGTVAQTAADYKTMVVAWRNNAPIRLSDVAEVSAGPEDVRTLGLFNSQPAVIVLITRQPGANIIETVDGVRALLPQLRAQLPSDIELQVASDSTNSIRSSLHEVELTLLISIALVVVVVSLFLRSARATFVPAVATVVSLLGTFGVMHLLGFSLNNLSLMALTVATGFVVDDAIVVLENASRHIEQGMDRFEAALLSAREVGFTVLSISLSLVAVFIPLLFMGGQVGRLFREFAVTLSAAVMISLLISLTTTPMMCAWLLKPGGHDARPPGRIGRTLDRGWQFVLRGYERSLDWALHAKGPVMVILLAVVALNVWLFFAIPKGFFPQHDSGQLRGGMRADQSISFQALQGKLRQLVSIIQSDPAVDTVTGFIGGGRAGGGFMFVNLKPKAEREGSAQAAIARLRPTLQQVTGVSLFLSPVQDLRMGGRQGNATYQYTLKSDNADDLKRWATRLASQLKAHGDVLTDVDTDQEESGVEMFVDIDHGSATRLGLSARDVDNALYDNFGQRQVSTLYGELNQYKVILEAQPRFTQSPLALNDVRVPAGNSATAAGNAASSPATSANPGLRDASTGNALNTDDTPMVPLTAIARFREQPAATSVNHQDAELATTIAFNLVEGKSLSDAGQAIEAAAGEIGLPANVRGSFQGTARSFQQNQGQQGLLILAALVTIYIVLGVLYESLVHPLTVLSTLPAAGVGATLALLLFDMEFSVIALIGLFLLIGIVKKNAILIIDFALDAERSRGLTALQAVREASLLRLRPILMTTLAAALGALPLAVGFGEGAELRRPLGLSIIGGLIASQLLTLLTTPVVYLLLDRLRHRQADERHLSRHAAAPAS
jgi:multidrug efflux pump